MEICAKLSPQFDLCYGLAEIVAPRPSATWLANPARADWFESARRFGSAFWLALPDVLGDRPPSPTVGAFLDALAAVPEATAHERLVRGLFHDADPARPSPRKREWLEFIGLDSGHRGNPTDAMLRRKSGAVLKAAIEVLGKFRHDFEPAWNARVAALRESRDRVAALARSDTLAGLAQALDLNVEVDAARKRLRALRGGYQIPFSDIRTVYLLPSFVNANRFWTVADDTRPATAFLPYMVPELAERAPPAVDPWLVCRALGDPTRAAIIRRLAAEPMTSAELMRELGLSKANVSHHIYQLREASLVDETPEGRAVRLSMRRDTIDRLSSAFRDALPKPSRGRAKAKEKP